MTAHSMSSLDRLSEALLSSGIVPWWEVRPERIKHTPTPSPEALAAAYCEDSPTERHVRWVEGNTETCKWCGLVRAVALPVRIAFNHEHTTSGRPPSEFNKSVRERLRSMAVGSTIVIEHHHLQCLFYESGGQKRCGLLRAVSRVRTACEHKKDWEVSHRKPFVGVVRRIA